MFKKKKTYIILLIIILVIGGIYYSKSQKPKAEYTTADVQKGDLAQTVSVTGKLAAPEQVDMSFKTGGRVDDIHVAVGDHVEKGQKIAKLDKGTFSADLAQAQADVKAQKMTLAYMKRKEGSYTKEQRDNQRALVAKAEAAVSELWSQFNDLTIYAPISGTVIKKGVEKGETVAGNSASAGFAIITIAADGDFRIEADIPESDIIRVILGQKADVTLDAFSSNDIFSAEVIEIEPASTVIQDVVYYKVKLKFIVPDQRFKNGMSADVDIKTDERKNIVYVPLRAVKTEHGTKFVEILKDEKNGVTEKITVTTGMEGDDGLVEIKSGLTGGEKVITLTKNK